MLSDGARVLACRVRAAPEDGNANAALCKLLAQAAGVPTSRARIATGSKARLKQVAIDGEPQALCAALARTLSNINPASEKLRLRTAAPALGGR